MIATQFETSLDAVDKILAMFKGHYGLDIADIVQDGYHSHKYKAKKIRALLKPALAKKFNRSESSPELDVLDDPASPDQVAPTPNIAYTKERLDYLKTIQGNEIFQFVLYTSESLQVLSQQAADGNDAAFALTTVGTGMAAFGLPMAVAVGKELWKVGGVVTKEILGDAVKVAIKSVGKVAVVATILVILADVLLFLADKEDMVFGMVFNELPQSLYVDDYSKGASGDVGYGLFMNHGVMSKFMYNFPFEAREGSAINGVAVDIDPTKSLYYAGTFAAMKAWGFFGVEGMVTFTAKELDARFVISFACPYGEDNGTNAVILEEPIENQRDIHDSLYKNRSLDVLATGFGYKIQTRTNHIGGNQSACMSFIWEDKAAF